MTPKRRLRKNWKKQAGVV